MGAHFRLTRMKGNAVNDVDPNLVAPIDILRLPVRRPDFGDVPVQGYIYYCIFRDAFGVEIPGASAVVTPWIADESLPNSWASGSSDQVGHREAFTNATPLTDASLFMALTNIIGGAASVELRLGVI